MPRPLPAAQRHNTFCNRWAVPRMTVNGTPPMNSGSPSLPYQVLALFDILSRAPVAIGITGTSEAAWVLISNASSLLLVLLSSRFTARVRVCCTGLEINRSKNVHVCKEYAEARAAVFCRVKLCHSTSVDSSFRAYRGSSLHISVYSTISGDDLKSRVQQVTLDTEIPSEDSRTSK